VPFIARYRKEATGGLDEVSIINLRDRLDQLARLEERRNSILRSLLERELLTDELKTRIMDAGTPAELEDLYLPFRPKRRTRAAMAREKGLEPLARRIFRREGGDPFLYAAGFIDPGKGVLTVEVAIAGAGDIIAEFLAEDPDVRERLRRLYWREGIYSSRSIRGREEEGANFRDYFDWSEPVRKAPSHRVLAMRRGEDRKVLALKVLVPEDRALKLVLRDIHLEEDSPEAGIIAAAASDSLRRLLSPSMETETRLRSREEAEDEAIRVFASNLRNLLLAPPLGRKPVLAVDPGFRTGCKLACLDGNGTLLEHATIFPFGSGDAAERAAGTVLGMLSRHRIGFVAVGNGTAGRETESFMRGLALPEDCTLVSASESGASVYSASQAARDEFPDLDITVRGAVSIGRRLQDPLAELVKIDPGSIGVGQYQHDVDQAKLRKALDDTVASCVNSVGVDLNTASVHLLAYVSGLNSSVAAGIVRRRVERGPFRTRKELMEVNGMGPVSFQQSAGFLRIRDGDDPLDGSAVHPERYALVEEMASSVGVPVSTLLASPGIRSSVDLAGFVRDGIGLPTLRDIMDELERPGRDPRETFTVFRFADVHSIGDLQEGMVLPGIVTNVTNFGAFVDVGVHQDGLVHVSRMSRSFVRNPAELVSAGDRIRVRVTGVDEERGRISLSMVLEGE